MIDIKSLLIRNKFSFDSYNDDKYIIFGWPRTGSSNLAAILDMHEKVKVLHEPLHPNPKVGVGFNGKTIKGLKKVLKEDIWLKGNCIKHVHGLTKKQNNYLLLHPRHKIMFLWRKNALKRAISNHIALQTKNFGSLTNNSIVREEMESIELQPLDIGELKKGIESYLKSVNYYKKILHERKKPYLEIHFEDLFESTDTNKGLEIIQSIFSFLNLAPVQNSQNLEQIQWRLNPENMQQSSRVVYSNIPNIKEIESRLGSSHNGWIFS